MIDFRQRVKDLCKEQGITQKDVAERMGLKSDVALNSLLRRGDPHISTAENLASVFGLSLAEFLQEKETVTNNLQHKTKATPLFVCPNCGAELVLAMKECSAKADEP